MRTFDFDVFGVTLQIQCPDVLSTTLVVGNFGAFETLANEAASDYLYKIRCRGDGPGYVIHAEHRPDHFAHDAYELLYYVEKSVTIDVQLARNDLYFVHAAAMERGGHACLLVAPPGSGKSTTAWGLMHHGFGYLSDELAPIDLDSLTVLPYPHALCLKQPPPAPYVLPPDTIRTTRTLHVPSSATKVTHPVPLKAIFFNRYDAAAQAPIATAISAGAASALMYANGLNQLAHARDGLEAVAAITEGVTCYQVTTAELTTTCALLRSIMDG